MCIKAAAQLFRNHPERCNCNSKTGPATCCRALAIIAWLERSGLGERLFEIGDDVLDVFDTDRQPHHVRSSTRSNLLLR